MTNQEKVKKLEEKLWKSASYLWSHGSLKPTEYTFPILWIIFLKFSDTRYKQIIEELKQEWIDEDFIDERDISWKWWIYLAESARYAYLLSLLEWENIGKKKAMEEVAENGYSLNSWRYVGVKQQEELSEEDFKTKLKALTKEFEELTERAHTLEEKILENVRKIVGNE